ncbi:Molybdopterin synthase catalytic subunit [Geodia barretti]|uniref:Molybdopterin synthase catalytic subunit n=1 Tax=Geodia barretti TaxID=519541 RepID=A0AA35R4H3_GEOBA|nr:Molybdopterin synthase catalytic subunit [Geodia barretti]
MTLTDGATVTDLISELASEQARFTDMAPSLMVSVNQAYVERDAELQDGDEVAFIPPEIIMAGDVYKIQDNEIKPDALYNAVLADSDGAVTTFAGVVRDNTKGRGTSYLVYDAYRDMAEKKMREIGDEVKDKWEVDCVGILHRVGRLKIGEISVLIAISSPHRKASLEACHYAIDQLKQTVPIWKKEVWTDGGEAWIEGDPSALVSR